MKKREDVAETLRQRVISGTFFGSLETNARLPSARQLALELHTDPRVVINAYARLEREGLVKRRKGSRGFFVAGPPTSKLLGTPSEWMMEMLERALSQGIHVPRFAEHVRRNLETVRLNAMCIECNTDQLEWICGELHDDYGIRSRPIELTSLRDSPESRDALARADLLVTTAAHASEVRRAAREVERACVIVTLRREIIDDVQRKLRAGPVYFICTDVRYATKLKQLYASSPGAHNLRTIVLGWHDPASIPAGAPVWILRTARARLGGIPPHLQALPTLRLFSLETTRALLSFVLHANSTALAAMAAQRQSSADAGVAS